MQKQKWLAVVIVANLGFGAVALAETTPATSERSTPEGVCANDAGIQLDNPTLAQAYLVGIDGLEGLTDAQKIRAVRAVWEQLSFRAPVPNLPYTSAPSINSTQIVRRDCATPVAIQVGAQITWEERIAVRIPGENTCSPDVEPVTVYAVKRYVLADEQGNIPELPLPANLQALMMRAATAELIQNPGCTPVPAHHPVVPGSGGGGGTGGALNEGDGGGGGGTGGALNEEGTGAVGAAT
jgi:hypothetical protein